MQQIPTDPTAADLDDEPTFDVRAFIAMLWRGKMIIAVCTLISLTLAFLSVSQIEARYQASAKVIFDLQQRNITNIEEVITTGNFSRERLQNELEVLRSTALIERVIDKLSLDENADFNPSLRP